MTELEALLERLESLLGELERIDDEATRQRVFELLDGIDALHRMAMRHLGAAVAEHVELSRLQEAHPAIAWLFDAYAVGIDEHTAAEQALEEIRPYVHSHGGEVEVLDVTEGVVHVRLAGSCSGCSASDITLTQGVEEALRTGLPGFVRLTVEEDDAPEHEPPGPTLLQIGSSPPAGFP